MKINEEKLAEKSYSSFLGSDGIHEVPPEQQEGMEDELEKIGQHEEKISGKLDKVDLSKLSPETKKNLSLLGRFKSIFAGKTQEEKTLDAKRKFEAKKAEYLEAVMEHPTARNVYNELLKTNPEKADLYLEAYSYYGLPLYWHDDEQRYGGSKPSIN